MKYTKRIAVIILFLYTSSCSKKPETGTEMYPPYRLIVDFSKEINPETGLVLFAYGINNGLPKNYEYINGVANFKAGYALYKKKEDLISLDYARQLLVFTAENMIKRINLTPEIIPDLDAYPATSDSIRISIYFLDEIKVQLGQGVAEVRFANRKIKYEGYEIREYTNRYPAKGRHYIIHEETYTEALEIVKKQGALIHL